MTKNKLHIAFWGIVITLLQSCCIGLPPRSEALSKIDDIPGFHADSTSPKPIASRHYTVEVSNSKAK